MSFSKSPIALAVGLCVSWPVLAAESASSEQRLKEVVVTGTETEATPKVDELSSPKRTQKVADIAQTVHVINEQVMQQQGVSSLRDALRNISGISMAAGEGGVPPGDNLTLRGFSARTDLFIDGVRDLGGYTRDPFNLESIEVVEGPSSAFSGRGSTGGSINQVSKAPKLDDFIHAEIGMGTDSFSRQTLDVNKPVGETSAVRINVLNHEADSPGRGPVFTERRGIAPSVAFGLDTATRVTISHLSQEQEGLPDYGVPYTATVIVPNNGGPLAVDHDTFYGLTDRDYEEIQADVSTVKIEHDFSDKLLLTNQTRYGVLLRDSIVTPPRLANATTVTRGGRARDTNDSILVNQTDLRWQFSRGDVEHALIVGLELAKEKSRNNTRSVANGANAPIDNPDPDTPYTGAISDTGYSSAQSDSRALYVFDTLTFGSQWQWNIGLRSESFKTDYHSETINTTPLDFDNRDSTVNYSTGLTFKPIETGSVYLAYGSSINPSAEGLTLSESTVDLDPEKNRSSELGSKWELLDRKLLLTAALFQTDKTSARTSDGTTGAVTVLEGEQRVRGFSVGVTGIISEKWQIISSYTQLNSEVLETRAYTTINGVPYSQVGNQLPNVPEQSWTVWTTYQLSDALQLGVGAQHVSSRFSNVNNLNEVPGYTLIDAMANYTFNEHFDLRLNVYNASDKEHYATVGGGHVVPGAERSAVLTAALTF